jgi:suppressor for copper-sensitivity B
MIIGFSIFSAVILSLILLILLLNKKVYKNKYGILIMLLLIMGSYYLYQDKVLDKYSLFSKNNSQWESYNSESLLSHISNGKTVFIDITADWCVTCKVNKLLVLNSKEFRNIINNNNIILMRGDWTKPDKEITSFLQESNRYGIPFNALYSLNYPKGYIFSELLTLREIKEGILMHRRYAK